MMTGEQILDWYLKKISVRAYQTAFMYVRKYIEQLPIKLPKNKSGGAQQHDLIVENVDKIIKLTGNNGLANEQQIGAADKAIDILVYKLYDLTADEIAIVEGRT